MSASAETWELPPLPVGPDAVLRGRDGTVVTLPVADWVAPADADEKAVLAQVEGPAIDLGCGPGRILEALDQLGIEAMGVDTSAAALEIARDRGMAVLERSVFVPLPASGRWRTAILLDGNVGIGGDPVALLSRVADLVAVGGRALVEVRPPGTASRTLEVRVEAPGVVGRWFPWSVVGADDLPALALPAGLRVERVEHRAGRWFAWLVHHDLTPVAAAVP